MLSKHTVWLAAQKPPCYNVSMGEVLKRRIKQKADFESPAQEAMLNLLVAGDYIHRRLERVCARFGLTRPQYNVLRMLRGAHPQGHPRGEIASRMLTRSPDVTRLPLRPVPRSGNTCAGWWNITCRVSLSRSSAPSRVCGCCPGTPRGPSIVAAN